ncbi:oleate hydratase [Convivina praedatoris]|uniref:Oleate hydratase n=1 Tax=Convivina praedatoris TaxID=2880963 RepID=A0ABM9D142_9LACO|nr:oleate hydratase [Convivina sp. LMG 32447]CAH1852247.1 Oleate hydratase [Convivina sp. LMG 32447]CAH1852282.1 Oleate hydratase [Convivina sp. LMG 32447]CAH1852664.1 Oleate hydratase [Convivina sp. LMG 32447]
MHYGSGNFEAFATPRKPENIEQKSAYIVGSGIAGLAAAVFLIRDGHMDGSSIHILEELPLAGGSLDGTERPGVGFVTRGGREMENHFECLWDLYRSIPSLEIPNASYLDEFYWLDKDDSNSSNCRLIYNRGNQVPDDGQYTLGKHSQELTKLIMATEESLGKQTIGDYFSDEFFESNFWTYWATMFAFEKWHSVIEMRRYAMRFIHHIDGLPDFTALKFNKYNQYDSMVKPLLSYLEDHHVNIQYDTQVKNVLVEQKGHQKQAKELQLVVSGQPKTIALTPDDLVFITNGSITESTTYGDHQHAAPKTDKAGGSWQLWENMAAQSDEFGHPTVFYKNLPEKSWFVSATATIKNPEVDPYIERLTKRSLHDHKVNTGGIITITDSNWMMSFAVHRQPHFKEQKPNETTVWIYGLYSDTRGNFINKKITDCSGEEITQELLYHLGVPESEINRLAQQNSINTVPVYMPFITSYFMPRIAGDRPAVVPNGSINLAFIGNFAESPSRDTVFTTEYSVRTAMEAVYSLLELERAVPEVFNSTYDIRELLKALYYMNDKKELSEIDLPIPKLVQKVGMQKIKGTWLEELLQEAHLI